jgi:hypothetical protein
VLACQLISHLRPLQYAFQVSRVALVGIILALVGNSQQFDPHVPNPAFPVGKGPRVLFDSAHFNFDTEMSAFFEILRKDGFRVSFQTKPWTPAFLELADIVVISGPLSVSRDSLYAKGNDYYWWSDEGRQDAFTSAEILALVRWVRAGGNLLVIVDHAPAPAASRRLLEALGVDARNSMTWDGGRRPPGYTYAAVDARRASFILFSREHGSIGEHSILRGRNEGEKVDRVATYVGTSLMGPLGSTPLLLLSDASFDYWKDPPERGGGEHRVSAAGRSQAVAFSLEKGRVVVVGEFSPFQARWGGAGDPDGKIGAGMAYAGAQDQQFVTNVVRWLGRVLP